MWNTSRNLRKYCGAGGRPFDKTILNGMSGILSVKILKAHTRNVTLNVWKLTSLVCAASKLQLTFVQFSVRATVYVLFARNQFEILLSSLQT